MTTQTNNKQVILLIVKLVSGRQNTAKHGVDTHPHRSEG